MPSGAQPPQDSPRPRGQDLLVGRVAAGLAQRRRLDVASRCLLQHAGRLLSLGLHRPRHVRRAVRRHLSMHGKQVSRIAQWARGPPQNLCELGAALCALVPGFTHAHLSTHSRCQPRRHPQHALGRAHPLGLWWQRRARARSRGWALPPRLPAEWAWSHRGCHIALPSW